MGRGESSVLDEDHIMPASAPDALGCPCALTRTRDNPGMSTARPKDAVYLEATREWLLKAVIGLNLCPFAKAPHVKNQIRYVVSEATTPEALQAELLRELQFLADVDPEQVDTTLLIHPHVLQDFLDYNDFLDVADETVRHADLDGVLQVASFHPDYQFGGTEADDIDNFTNRSPFPTLHLIREASIDRAVEAFPEAEMIYERNMATLRGLGLEGWRRLWVREEG
jgi:hypothetical protein